MTRKILYSGNPRDWDRYHVELDKAFADRDLDAQVSRAFEPDDADYIVYCPDGFIRDFRPYTRCKAVLSLWAGVDRIVANRTLTQPLARLVDPGMTQGMTEYVVANTLRHHLGLDAYIREQSGRVWNEDAIPPLASARPVTILGLGALGSASATALASLGFPVTGWSSTQKSIPGVTCLAGPVKLMKAVKDAEILVLLLPLTAATENIVDADTLAELAPGAAVINPGRGPLLDDAALLKALDTGHLSGATLDVFREEPLPASNPYWAHPKVTVTPHIASATRVESASKIIAENIARVEDGKPLLNQVDFQRGY